MPQPVEYRPKRRGGGWPLILLAAATWAGAAETSDSPTTPAPAAPAESAAPAAPTGSAEETEAPDTLTGQWFGAGTKMEAQGLSLRLNLTQAYQGVVHGGLATHRHAGRYTGTYNLELEGNLEKLAGIKGGSFYLMAEGGWSDGLDASSVGSLFGTNYAAIGDHSARLVEFHYDQTFWDDRLRLRLGKIDLSGDFECRGCRIAFDGNAYANDQTAQFLNGALVNNPTIPFPDRGLGVVLYFQPTRSWYLAAGVADAQAEDGETGFNTAFHGKNYTLSLYEAGLLVEAPSAHGPLPGAYRVGLWYDPQPKPRFDGGGTRRDDVGLYMSFDQLLWRECPEAKDDQGLGVFARFGFADEAVNPIRSFWSAGAQYTGLLPGRDADVLGIGLARGRTSDAPGAGFTAAHETVAEIYYNIEVTPWLHVSPHVQYVADPGGLREVPDAVVAGVRIQATF